jgi:hypothetical protein
MHADLFGCRIYRRPIRLDNVLSQGPRSSIFYLSALSTPSVRRRCGANGGACTEYLSVGTRPLPLQRGDRATVSLLPLTPSTLEARAQRKETPQKCVLQDNGDDWLL